jgi:hypothetical protein
MCHQPKGFAETGCGCGSEFVKGDFGKSPQTGSKLILKPVCDFLTAGNMMCTRSVNSWVLVSASKGSIVSSMFLVEL